VSSLRIYTVWSTHTHFTTYYTRTKICLVHPKHSNFKFYNPIYDKWWVMWVFKIFKQIGTSISKLLFYKYSHSHPIVCILNTAQCKVLFIFTQRFVWDSFRSKRWKHPAVLNHFMSRRFVSSVKGFTFYMLFGF